MGNKSDLENKAVTSEDIKAFSDETKLKVFEISAKDGKNIYDVMEDTTKELIQRQ